MKKLFVLGFLLALPGCGGDGYGNMRIDRGGAGSGLTNKEGDPEKYKPSNKFCKQLAKKNCLDIINSHSSSTLACIEAQQLYLCGYTSLDGDSDGYLCEATFAGKTCSAPNYKSINFEWKNAPL